MKKVITIIAAITFFTISCSEGSKQAKLQSDLKSKKEAFEKLRKEITELQMEIDKLDTTGGHKGKPVHLTNVVLGAFVHSIDIQGRVDAEESITVGPQMPGLIKRVNVQAGDKVVAGQVLAELDADAMTQQLASLKTQRDLAKNVYERQENLWNQKIGTEVQFLQTKAQYEALEKSVAALQEQIDMSRVKAPMAGVIDQVNMKVGEMGMTGFSTITIVNTNVLKVKAEVAEGYVSQVKAGNKVNIYIPDANKTIESKINYSGRIISKMNRTFNVEALLNPNEPNVVPNMVAVLRINDYSNDSAVVAPLGCIQESSNGHKFVFVAEKDKDGKFIARKREVTYEHSYNGNAEILSGLNPGDQLVTEGYSELNDGDMISGQ